MKYRKWRESNELRVGVTWHISFHRSMYFRNTWFSSLPLFRNLLSERHILSSKLTNAQMNGWWINMNGLQVQGLLCLLQRTLPVHSGRMILYFNVRRAVFFFFQCPISFHPGRGRIIWPSPLLLAHYAVNIIKKWDWWIHSAPSATLPWMPSQTFSSRDSRRK